MTSFHICEDIGCSKETYYTKLSRIFADDTNNYILLHISSALQLNVIITLLDI